MTYHSDHSPSASRANQLDQRQNGILNFDQRNSWNEGQAAISLGSSSTGIEVDLEGCNALINGSKVSVPPNTVTLSDGSSDPSLWRLDHIYATESGNFAVQEGELLPNTYVEHAANDGQVVEVIRENETAGGPAPKGPDFSRTQGELMFSVLVPPGTTTPQGLTFPQHVHDRRRLAPDVLDLEMPRQPSISAQLTEMDRGEWRAWPVVAWSGQTLRLWEYTIITSQLGMFTSDNFRLYLVDYIDSTNGIPASEFEDGINWSDWAIWESGQTRQSSRGDPSEVIFERDLTGETDAHAFVLENESDLNYSGEGYRIGLQATYSIENTDDL